VEDSKRLNHPEAQGEAEKFFLNEKKKDMLGRGEGFEDVKPSSSITPMMNCCIWAFCERIFLPFSFQQIYFFQFRK